MSPGKPAGIIKTVVPRHNAQRIGNKLAAEVKSAVSGRGARADLHQPGRGSSGALIQAIVRFNFIAEPRVFDRRMYCRKAHLNGIHFWLPPVPRGAHNGMSIHNSMNIDVEPITPRSYNN
jgi:hypothetical protein